MDKEYHVDRDGERTHKERATSLGLSFNWHYDELGWISYQNEPPEDEEHREWCREHGWEPWGCNVTTADGQDFDDVYPGGMTSIWDVWLSPVRREAEAYKKEIEDQLASEAVSIWDDYRQRQEMWAVLVTAGEEN